MEGTKEFKQCKSYINAGLQEEIKVQDRFSYLVAIQKKSQKGSNQYNNVSSNNDTKMNKVNQKTNEQIQPIKTIRNKDK